MPYTARFFASATFVASAQGLVLLAFTKNAAEEVRTSRKIARRITNSNFNQLLVIEIPRKFEYAEEQNN